MDPRAPVFVPRARVPPNVTSINLGSGNGRVVDTKHTQLPPLLFHSQPPFLLFGTHPVLQPTVFLKAGQPGHGFQQSVVTTTGPPPVIFTPITSETLSVVTDAQSLDLQMLKPETFSCGLPAIDLPTPALPFMPVVNTASPVVKLDDQTKPNPSCPKPNLKPKPKPKHKPRATKTPAVKRAVPEKTPFFAPVPLGAKHAKTKIQFLGDKIALSKRPGIYQALHKTGPGGSGINQNTSAKYVTSRKGYKALVSELPLFAEKDQHKYCKTPGSVKPRKAVAVGERSESNHASDNRIEKDMVSESNASDKCIKKAEVSESNKSDNHIEKADVSESNASDTCDSIQNVTLAQCSGKYSTGAASTGASTDEYEIEYLYLTKFILRKKNQPLGQKRKCSDEEQPTSSCKKHKGESRDLKIIPEVFHFQDTESLLSSDILDLF